MERCIIGFGHKRRRGKDTAALNALHWFKSCRMVPFAAPLKEGIGRGVFGLTDAQLYGEEKTVVDTFWGLTPREILQRAGTEAMRNGFDQDIWIQAFTRTVLNCSAHVVCPDVRFSNEAEAIKHLGGCVVRIDRKVPPGADGEDTHASETALDGYTGWDHVLDNNGSLKDLKTSVCAFLKDYTSV